jgi:hypothetical protein
VFFFGLVSKTQEGKALLEENGWESAPELNVCVPKSSSNTFLKIESKNAEDSWAVVCPDAPIIPNMPKEHCLSEVYLYLCNLSNHITTETASRNLKRLEPLLFFSFSHFSHFSSSLLSTLQNTTLPFLLPFLLFPFSFLSFSPP